MQYPIRKAAGVLVSCLAMLVTTSLLVGCERKEKILDIETPNGEIEVERSVDTGEVDVKVDEH